MWLNTELGAGYLQNLRDSNAPCMNGVQTQASVWRVFDLKVTATKLM